MADVTTTFAAKDESFARTVDNLSNRLQGFQGETASFTSKVGEMAKGFAAFAVPIAAVAGAFFGAKGAAQAFSDAIRIGGELNDLSARTGETAGELAVLQRAFQNAGSSGEAVGPMLNRLQRFMIEASEGGKTQIEAMEKLGLSYDELKEKSPSEQMQLLAARISEIDDPAQRSALAMQIFGRSGGELMPLLRAMGEELDTARAQLGSYPEAIDRANKALDAIGDNFGALATKVREFVTGALVDIAPTIARATDELAKMDFAAMGMRLSEALTNAFDVFRALWQNPSQIIGLLGESLNATLRLAGDNLASAFLTAGNTLANLLRELVDRGAFSQFGDVLANAFLLGATKLNIALLDVMESVVRFYGTLWNAVTGQGASDLAGKLGNVVKFFASDFAQAMSNPIAFISGKVASSLAQASQQAAGEYEFAFNSSTGSWIEKTRAGLTSVAEASGQRMKDDAAQFGQTLVDSATSAAAKSDVIKVNLFGGAEAMQQVQDKVSTLAAQGASFRAEIEATVPPAEKVGEAVGALPENGISLKDALAKSFPLVSDLRNEASAMAQQGQVFKGEVSAAKIDAQITSDLFKGLSDRMNSAVGSTGDMLDKMREAFHFGASSEKESSEMRRLENQVRLAENARDRQYERAERMEKYGQEKAAHELRMRADAQLTKTLETIRPELEKASETARKNLEEGTVNIGKSGEAIGDGGSSAQEAMEKGGKDAGDALEKASDSIKEIFADTSDQLALEKTLTKCFEELKKLNEKLPQNSLS